MSTYEISEKRLGQYAGFITRLCAWLLDRLILAGVFFVIHFVGDYLVTTYTSGSDLIESIMTAIVYLIDLIIYIIYFVGSWMIAGQTIGKSLFGLRVVRSDGERLKLRNALIRLIGYWLSSFLFYAGFWWSLFDKKRQTLHDHLAGTIVVYSETWEERAQQKILLKHHLAQRRQ